MKRLDFDDVVAEVRSLAGLTRTPLSAAVAVYVPALVLEYEDDVCLHVDQHDPLWTDYLEHVLRHTMTEDGHRFFVTFD